MPIIQKGTSVQVLPLNDYPNQTTTLPSSTGIQVASDVTSILISVKRCTNADTTIWPNASTTLLVVPEISTDDGTTWAECGRSMTNGGIITNKFGNDLLWFRAGGSIPAEVGGISRRYRCTVTVAGGPLHSLVNIEVN